MIVKIDPAKAMADRLEKHFRSFARRHHMSSEGTELAVQQLRDEVIRSERAKAAARTRKRNRHAKNPDLFEAK